MRFDGKPGYVFAIDLSAVPEVETGAHECCALMAMESPRTIFFRAPRAVPRMALLQLSAHLRAVLDGRVRIAEPHDEDGYEEFPALSLRVRQVPSRRGFVTLHLAFHDCGCDDRVEFEHSAALEVTLNPQALAWELDQFEAELWADASVESTG